MGKEIKIRNKERKIRRVIKLVKTEKIYPPYLKPESMIFALPLVQKEDSVLISTIIEALVRKLGL